MSGPGHKEICQLCYDPGSLAKHIDSKESTQRIFNETSKKLLPQYNTGITEIIREGIYQSSSQRMNYSKVRLSQSLHYRNLAQTHHGYHHG